MLTRRDRRRRPMTSAPFGRAFIGKEFSDGVAEQELIFSESELHLGLLPGQAEHALGDDVALNFIRARIDRATQCELESLHPRSPIDCIG